MATADWASILPITTEMAPVPHLPMSRFPQPNPLAAKLGRFCELDGLDEQALRSLCWDSRAIRDRRTIVHQGDRPERIYLMLQGWAASYKLMPDGMRQITGFMLPGDFSDLRTSVLAESDHGIVAITAARVALVTPATLERVRTANPRLRRALQRNTLVDEATLRAWIVNLGRRGTLQRTAHLLCELAQRSAVLDLPGVAARPFPLTQEVLSDALGITSVYMNRILQSLVQAGCITVGRRALTIRDVDSLQDLCGFDGTYLGGGIEVADGYPL